jgi:hypothetical protein
MILQEEVLVHSFSNIMIYRTLFHTGMFHRNPPQFLTGNKGKLKGM